jgi:hypothetical protein
MLSAIFQHSGDTFSATGAAGSGKFAVGESNPDSMSQGREGTGPESTFADPIAALLDAQDYVMAKPEADRSTGEFSGEVDYITFGEQAATYSEPRYEKGTKSTNLVARNTAFFFHSHLKGERPSQTDFDNVGRPRANAGAQAAIFAPSGNLIIYSQSRILDRSGTSGTKINSHTVYYPTVSR